MKLRYTLTLAALSIAATSNAQNWIPDTVSMGPNYVNNVFYSLENGISGAPKAENTWHIAVEALPFNATHHGGAGIWTNEANKNGQVVKLYALGLNATAKFNTITAADTVGKMINALHNDTSSYADGAFNKVATGESFNYGWGTYYMNNAPGGYPAHSLVGDTLFLLNLVTAGAMGGPSTINQSFIVWPRAFVGGNQWTIYFKELGSSEVDTISISTANKHNMFNYYDLLTKQVVDREPIDTTWDFQFTNYMDLYGAQGQQGVTGVLQNYNVAVTQVDGIVPNNATIDNTDTTSASSSYVYNLNTIGNDWKSLNSAFQWEVKEERSYFLKTNKGDIWQFYFDYFGTIEGERKIGLQKRKVFTYVAPPTNINNIYQQVNTIVLAPNPSTERYTNLVIDAKEQLNNTIITITDLSGRTIFQSSKNLDVATYPVGMYMVNVNTNGATLSQKLIIK
jgi:hypothetical protein